MGRASTGDRRRHKTLMLTEGLDHPPGTRYMDTLLSTRCHNRRWPSRAALVLLARHLGRNEKSINAEKRGDTVRASAHARTRTHPCPPPTGGGGSNDDRRCTGAVGE